jgi:hypothetical protein
MGKLKDLELECSQLVLDLETLGMYGLGYFAGLLVENRPQMAQALAEAIRLNFEESEATE